MKTNRIVVLTFAVPWLVVLLGMEMPDWRASLTEHRFLKMGAVSFSAPGFRPAIADEKVIESSDVARWLRNWGYAFRTRIGMYPPWVFIVPDPFEPEARQIVLREEVAEEFKGDATGAVHAAAAERVASRVRDLNARKKVRTAVLAVPTKVAANQLIVGPADGALGDAERLGITETSARVGAFHLQQVFERRLGELDVPVVSPVDLYRELQSKHRLLYPRGDSHWSPVVIAEVAQLAVRDLARKGFFAAECIRNPGAFTMDEKFHFLGDLYARGLGWSEEFRSENPFDSLIAKVVAQPTDENVDGLCPLISLIGSSYSLEEFGSLSLGKALQATYRGRVLNRSLRGEVPHTQLLKAGTELEEGGIVLWEFPFRLVKKVE